MRLDQIPKRSGAAPARSVTADAGPPVRDRQPTPAPDPLAELERLIRADKAFASIVPDNGRSKRDVEFPVRRHEPRSSARAGEDIPSKQSSDGDLDSQLVASATTEAPNGEPHNLDDDGDYEEPEYSEELPDRRRWLRMSAAIIGLALVGCASALAYLAWSDGRVTIEEARVTGASTAPEKLMPPPQREDSRPDARPDAQSSVAGGGGTTPAEETPAGAQSAVPQALPPMTVPSGPAPTQVAALTTGAAPPDGTAAAQNQPPTATEAAPGPTAVRATEPSVGGGSKYIVQLSSQRSEAAAQATSRGLQSKYADLFGGLQPFIRRADLRDRGVYYRVLIGPFAAIGEANQLCGSLKKSGGDCVVQRN